MHLGKGLFLPSGGLHRVRTFHHRQALRGACSSLLQHTVELAWVGSTQLASVHADQNSSKTRFTSELSRHFLSHLQEGML